ncbi:MAG: S49 family peptidase [Treponema sp.]|nr:S49 family peptidase [Treponema sp.]
MKLNGKTWIIGACLLMASPKAIPLFSQHMYLELNLNNQAVRSMVRSIRHRSSLELLRVIERAGSDNRIDGIILNISSYHAGREAIWELRNALEKFKSKGKTICAFIGNADLDMYSLATVADKIIMDELGILTMLGYAIGRGYVQHSLEKLGIGVRELRYFEFKTSAETFTRDSLSDADRIQYGELLDDIMGITRETIIKARQMTAEELDSIINNEFMFSAGSALARGLVDRTGRKDAVIEAIKEISGSGNAANFAVFGDQKSSITGSKYMYRPLRAGNFFYRPPEIAVIYASGVTDMEQGIAAWTLASTIREVSERRRVKAIVLRISSSGGSAEAADYVAEAIKAARQQVPVVVSMGEVAASGGYWASMNASHIVASPVTITGSIGVIGSWFYDNGLNDKLGLTVDTMQRGNHADMMTGMILPRRDLRPEEEARYREYILAMYADFTSRVAVSRSMDRERAESIAGGRIYSGLGALNAGLIDSNGGLDDAIRIARNLAGIPDNQRVAYSEYPKPKFFDKMFERMAATKAVAMNSAVGRNSVLFAANWIFPVQILDDLHYRIAHNGHVMPLLPFDQSWLLMYP